MIATGTPISSGHGVAITSTARNRLGSADQTQPPTATASASAVYQPPSRSASRRIGGRSRSASASTPTIWAYRESAARFVARTVSADSPLIAPDITADPGNFSMTYGSPVRYD